LSSRLQETPLTIPEPLRERPRPPFLVERSVGLSLPLPISARIDLLVALAEQVGERTSRPASKKSPTGRRN
jgi:hypothetical protein